MSAKEGRVNPVWAEIIECGPTDPSRLVRYMKRELAAINKNPMRLWGDMDSPDIEEARVWLERWIEEHA